MLFFPERERGERGRGERGGEGEKGERKRERESLALKHAARGIFI